MESRKNTISIIMVLVFVIAVGRIRIESSAPEKRASYVFIESEGDSSVGYVYFALCTLDYIIVTPKSS